MRFHSAMNRHQKQTGSTLIMSLIILMMVMMLGLTAMMTSNSQFKLAGNLQFDDLAMNNAEAAIAEAEIWLSTGTNYVNAGLISDVCNSRSVPQLYPLNNTVNPPTTCLSGIAAPGNDPLTMVWDNTTSIQSIASTNARYLIELLSTNNILIGSTTSVGGRTSSGCNKVNTYMITALGTSARGATKHIQSYFSVLSC